MVPWMHVTCQVICYSHNMSGYRRLLRSQTFPKKIRNEPQKFHVSPLTKEMFPRLMIKAWWGCMVPAGVSSGVFFSGRSWIFGKRPPPDRLVFLLVEEMMKMHAKAAIITLFLSAISVYLPARHLANAKGGNICSKMGCLKASAKVLHGEEWRDFVYLRIQRQSVRT